MDQDSSEQVVEKPHRSMLKALSWRVTGTLDTILISFIITGSAGKAFSIGGVEVITKMVLYYLHERAWNRLRVGRVVTRPPEYQI